MFAATKWPLKQKTNETYRPKPIQWMILDSSSIFGEWSSGVGAVGAVAARDRIKFQLHMQCHGRQSNVRVSLVCTNMSAFSSFHRHLTYVPCLDSRSVLFRGQRIDPKAHNARKTCRRYGRLAPIMTYGHHRIQRAHRRIMRWFSHCRLWFVLSFLHFIHIFGLSSWLNESSKIQTHACTWIITAAEKIFCD